MDRQQVDELQTQRLELLEQEVLRLSELEKKTKEMETEPADISDTSSNASVPDSTPKPEELYGLDDIEEIEEIDEIEELDDEIELDDLFRELEAMGAEETEEPAGVQQRQEPAQPTQAPPPQPAQEPPPQPAQAPPPQAVPEAPQPALEPTRYHQGYNIGRSGKKYTAEELNMLIRE